MNDSMEHKDVISTNPFAVTLLKWFQEYGRSLPWRETTDPYAISVSYTHLETEA